jgi:hypothetical protein
MLHTCCLLRKLLPGAFMLAALMAAGCERKEEVLDIETPEGQIEVERSKDTGELDIEVDR